MGRGVMRVGILEARMAGEMAALVRRHGGEPRLAPSVRESPLDAEAEVRELVRALEQGDVEIVVFLTGVGATALFAEAERAGLLPDLVRHLSGTVNVCRGQKPWPALRRHGVPISVTVASPYTTADVIVSLRDLAPAGRGVALLHYGERSDALTDALCSMGARVSDLCLYEWRLPDDTRPIERLVEEVVAGEIEAVAFTSQVQVRHLLEVARRAGREAAFREGLRRVVVAAVGPTCAAALSAEGIEPRIVPTNPKMGPMVVALMAQLRRVKGEE